jgi:molecular chaperone DnaJ
VSIFDPYSVLGVRAEASAAEIKRAYRQQAKRLHPDCNPDDPAAAEKFKALQAAYELLNDPRRRAELHARAARVRPASRPPGRATGERGQDLLLRLRISLAEVARGAWIRMEVPRFERCAHCAGAGRDPAGSSRRCKHCQGSGRAQLKRRLEVKVPPGVEEGSRLKILGEGDAGPLGGPTGDLIVTLEVAKHPLLRREGALLSCEVPVPFGLAALGGDLQVPTPEGSASLTLPPGTQSGQVFRLRGQGLPRTRGKARADLLVTVRVEVPEALPDELRQALRALASLDGEDTYPRATQYNRVMTSLRKRRA